MLLNNKKTLGLISIYLISFVLIIVSIATIISNDERINYLEFSDIETEIEEEINRFLHKEIFKNSRADHAIIYYLDSKNCNICNIEIEEFSNLVKDLYPVESIIEYAIIKTNSEVVAENLINNLNIKTNYHYNLDEYQYNFFSNYELRNLVGQVLLIDINQNKVKGRVILEKLSPSTISAVFKSLI